LATGYSLLVAGCWLLVADDSLLGSSQRPVTSNQVHYESER